MDRHPLTHPISVAEAAKQIDQCAADLSDTIRNTPISLDLLRIRAVVDQRGPRHTVAEINELELTYHTLRRKLEPYRQSAFSLHDLRCATFDAGFPLDDCGGDPAVFLPGATDDDRIEFQVRVAQASPRYAEAILKAATWLPVTECFFWSVREIERRAA